MVLSNLFRSKKNRDSYNELPSAKLLPLIGIANQFRSKSVNFLLHLSRTYGDFVKFPSPGIRGVLVSDPEFIKQILAQTERNYYKGKIYDLTRPLIGNGLVTNQGASWRAHRKMANPAFTEVSLQDYEPHIQDATKACVAKIEAHLDQDLDSTRYMMDLTFDVVAKSLFSTQLGNRASELASCFAEGQDYLGWLFWTPLTPPLSLPTARNKRFIKARDTLTSYISDLIEKRRNSEPQNDLLQKLIDASDDNQKGFSQQQLIDEVLTLMIAGHDTTALTLCYGLEQLAGSKTTVDKMRDEIQRVCGDKAVTIKDLPKLKYLRMVLQEIMRLCPAVYMINRTCNKAVTYKDMTFQEDTTFFLSQFAVHRHKDYWDEPDQFIPERWENPELVKSPAYFPFGGGPRSCIGNHLAMFEAGVALPEIIRRFDIRSSKRPYRFEPNATMTPSPGVYLRFSEV